MPPPAPPDSDAPSRPDSPATSDSDPQEARRAAGPTGKRQEARRTEGPTGNQDDPPSPLTPRQEAFCHYFVLWGNASVAAREAGYAASSARNQGYRLARRPRVRARIAQLRRGLARAYGLDAEVLVGKLEALYQRAVEDHDFHAAARAVELQARMAGHVAGRFRLAPAQEARRTEGPTGTQHQEARRTAGPTGTRQQEARRTAGPTGTQQQEMTTNDDPPNPFAERYRSRSTH